MGKLRLGVAYKTALLEEFGEIGESKNAFDTERAGFIKAFFNKPFPDSLTFEFLFDRKGLDLGEIGPVNVKRGASDEHTSLFRNPKITDIFIQVVKRSGNHPILFCIIVDKLMHRRHIA
jgi:hypothetical protein